MSENNQNDEELEESFFTNDDSKLAQDEQRMEVDPNLALLSKLEKSLAEREHALSDCQDKLKRSLADYQNLERKTKTDIKNGINLKIDKFMIKFLSIYDDFIRAKKILSQEKIDVSGFDSLLKNIDSLLSEYNISPINAVGEIFNPNFHEAISVIEDPSLDDGTITKEIRKGYISQNRVIRPTIVEISKKLKLENSKDEQNGQDNRN